MDQLTLYEFESPSLRISMKVYFNEENQLIFDGHDIGTTVNELVGDSDYEYQYKVGLEEVRKIAALFHTNVTEKMVLLQEIKNRFYENDAYSKFGTFMKENNIAFQQFTWR